MSSALELRVDELGHRFTVSRARGREALSRTYWFDVSLVTTRRIPLEGRSLVGHAATLVIPSDGESARKIRGVIASQRVDGHAAPGDAQQFRVRLVPRMALLRHRVNSRVFQDRTVVEIVGSLGASVGASPKMPPGMSPPTAENTSAPAYRTTGWPVVSVANHVRNARIER